MQQVSSKQTAQSVYSKQIIDIQMMQRRQAYIRTETRQTSDSHTYNR